MDIAYHMGYIKSSLPEADGHGASDTQLVPNLLFGRGMIINPARFSRINFGEQVLTTEKNIIII
ncbi:hypothetical protein [Algoriphagus sp. Y33]|uniref:hypothetical protein n=1 Tax=Algoriphagus sp. Y33 TaxID=2772483 RepID=UPI00178002B0|nr:hypothetical protein [Algoriphagus sp. Y33]